MSTDPINELLDALAAAPIRIQSLLNRVSDAQLRQRQAAGEFSCVETVCHLRDIETEGYTARINRILSEDQPFLPDLDGGRLAVERDYNQQDVQAALRAFLLARTENLSTLRGLDARQLDRSGTLEGVGLVTLEGLLTMMRDHDGGHISDVEQILQEAN
jgi:DinB superfamily